MLISFISFGLMAGLLAVRLLIVDGSILIREARKSGCDRLVTWIIVANFTMLSLTGSVPMIAPASNAALIVSTLYFVVSASFSIAAGVIAARFRKRGKADSNIV